MFFKIDRASLIVGSKFTVFALFYFLFEGNFQVHKPPPPPRRGGAYIWRGDLTEGFLRYQFGSLYLEGLILGGAYTWSGLFSEFYGSSVLDLSEKIQQTVCLLSAKGFVGSLKSSG